MRTILSAQIESIEDGEGEGYFLDNRRVAQDVCLMMKNIGKPCTGKPYARFDEGALRKKERTLEHVVAACGEA